MEGATAGQATAGALQVRPRALLARRRRNAVPCARMPVCAIRAPEPEGATVRRAIEFDLETRTPNATRFTTPGGMHANAAFIERQKKTVRGHLTAHFNAWRPGLFVTTVEGLTIPNRITVSLTRIAGGKLDRHDNNRMAFKGVVDSIAAWIGPKDHEAIYVWDYPEPEVRRGCKRVRIVIDDLDPRPDRPPVVLAAVVTERKTKEAKMRARTTGEQAAAKVARRLFWKRRKPRAAPLQHSTYGAVAVDAGGIALNGKPTATDLRDAYEGAMRRTKAPPFTADTMPADLAAMRAQARSVQCPECLGMPGGPCEDLVREVAWEYGVHASRARAAGLPPYPSAAELDAGMRPVREDVECGICDGKGAVPGMQGHPRCDDCNGTGKAKRWRWVMGPAKRAEGSKPDKAGRNVTGSAECHGTRRMSRPDGDPGEERSPRQLVPCPRASCFAALDVPCVDDPGGVFVFGVHVERAAAAGVRLTGDCPQPKRAPQAEPSTNGRRVIAGPRSLPAYLVAPWAALCRNCEGFGDVHAGEASGTKESACDACGGRQARPLRWPACDGADPPRTVLVPVPERHRARWGERVKVTRREGVLSGDRCWIYETI